MKKPKLLVICGPSGCGKTTFISQYIDKNQYKILNIDDIYEELLIKEIGHLDQNKYTSYDRSVASSCMGQSNKMIKELEEKFISDRENVLIDTTGAYFSPLIKRINKFISTGYEVEVKMILCNYDTCLYRNYQRERKLLNSIVSIRWKQVVDNIPNFRNEIKNFEIIWNDTNPIDSPKWENIREFFNNNNYEDLSEGLKEFISNVIKVSLDLKYDNNSYISRFI